MRAIRGQLKCKEYIALQIKPKCSGFFVEFHGRLSALSTFTFASRLSGRRSRWTHSRVLLHTGYTIIMAKIVSESQIQRSS